MSSLLLILLIFLRVAILGFGKEPFVSFYITFFVSGPEILITPMPDVPDPDDRA